MKFSAHIAGTLAAARHRKMAPYAAIVFAAAMVGAAFAGLWVVGAVRLQYHSDSEIVGWVTANHYCKRQEVFDLLVAMAGLPAGLLAGWWTWVLGAAWGARFARCSPSRMLRQLAMAGAGMLALIPALARFEDSSPLPLVAALSGVTLAGLVLVIFNRLLGVDHDRGCLARDDLGDVKNTEAPLEASRASFHPLWRVLRYAIVWLVLPALIYVLSRGDHVNSELDYYNQFHEGERLYPMWVMRHGGVPYRDAYLQHGLFRNAIVPQVGAILYGPTLEGLRRVEDLVWPLGVLSVYLAGAALVGSNLVSVTILAVFLLSWRVQIPERIFFAGLSMAVMAAAIKRSRLWNLLRPPDARAPFREKLTRFLREGWPLSISGALASLAFWTSVDSGLFVFAGMGLFLVAVAVLGQGRGVWVRLKPLAAFGVGALVGLAAVGAYFARHGALGDLIRNVYQQCAYQTETWGLPFPNLLDTSPLSDDVGASAWRKFLLTDTAHMYFPFLVLLLAEAWLVWLWVHKRLWTSPRGWCLLLVTCVGLCFSRGLLGRSDDQHMYNGLIFQFLIGAMALDATLGILGNYIRAFRTAGRQGRPTSLAYPLLALILLGLTVDFFGDSYHPLDSVKERAHLAWERHLVAATTPPAQEEPFPGAGRISVPEADIERVQGVIAFIQVHTNPGEAIINFSSHATLLFFADRPSATRYFLPCYTPTPAMQREAIAEIEREQPRLAYRGLSHGFDDLENVQRQPLINAYLESHYEPIGKVEDIEFLWRKGAKP
jgi:hypothetical protein